MSKELLNVLVGKLLDRHPLPWTVEHDWTVEVYDVNKKIVVTLQQDHTARELIGCAERIAAERKKGDEELEKFLVDEGIEL